MPWNDTTLITPAHDHMATFLPGFVKSKSLENLDYFIRVLKRTEKHGVKTVT